MLCELSAVDLQPSMDKNGMQNEKIYEKKGKIKQSKNVSISQLLFKKNTLELLLAYLVSEVCQASKVFLTQKEIL